MTQPKIALLGAIALASVRRRALHPLNPNSTLPPLLNVEYLPTDYIDWQT